MRSAIVHKEISEGVLPSESELMMAFSASRQTVRDALQLLGAENLVRRVPGNGTFVTAAKVSHPFDHLHGPYTDRRVTHRIGDVETVVASPRVAERLGLEVGRECGMVEYVTLLDEEPYYVCTAYVPSQIVPLLRHVAAVNEWYALYERAGIELGISDLAIEATVADEFTSEHLDIPFGAPVMHFERLVRDRSGNPLEYAFARVRGDRITLNIQTPRQHRRPTERSS